MDLVGDDLLQDALPPGRAARIRLLSTRKALLFACVCAIWLAAGLFGRDPWKPQETKLAPVAAHFAENGISLVPDLLGAPFLENPPMLAWLGALAAQALPLLPVHEAARVASALLVALGLLFVGLAAARKGGAHSGWMAVLLAVGTIGFAPRAHWFQNGVAEFAASAAMLWGAILLAENTLAGALVLGFAGGFLFLSAGISESALVLAAVFAVVLAHSHWRGPREKIAALAGTVAFASPWFLIWPLAFARESPEIFSEWLEAETPFGNGFHIFQVADLLKTAAWAGFPTLPILAAGVWAGGRRLAGEPLTALCLAVCAAGAILFFHDGGDEVGIFIAVPALAAGAARVIQRLPENRAASLDWFALLVLGLGGVGGLWLVWLAFRAGFPAPVADWAAAQTVGAETAGAEMVGFWAIAAAAVLTLAWLALLANFRRSNERAVVNWSCGVTVAWCVFNLLWLPQVDAVKSYRSLANAVSERAGAECVAARGIPPDAAAQLDYFGVNLQAGGDGEKCPFGIFPTAEAEEGGGGESESLEGELLWRGSRPGERSESFDLRRRARI